MVIASIISQEKTITHYLLKKLENVYQVLLSSTLPFLVFCGCSISISKWMHVLCDQILWQMFLVASAGSLDVWINFKNKEN